MLIIGNAVGDPLYIADFSEDSMEFLDNTHGTLLRAWISRAMVVSLRVLCCTSMLFVCYFV